MAGRMKNSLARGAELAPIEFIPHDVEVIEVTYSHWLLAGGAPIPEFHAQAWASTVPASLGEVA